MSSTENDERHKGFASNGIATSRARTARDVILQLAKTWPHEGYRILSQKWRLTQLHHCSSTMSGDVAGLRTVAQRLGSVLGQQRNRSTRQRHYHGQLRARDSSRVLSLLSRQRERFGAC